MAIPKGTDKPSLAEQTLKRSKEEAAQRGKKIDKERQAKSSRNGGALKKSKKFTLTGDEQYLIQGFIEGIRVVDRTATERRLLRKVRGR